MFCGSRRSKSRLAKAAGAEPFREMRDEKLHAVAARSAFRSQSAKNLIVGTLLEVQIRKSARRCGAKHMSKSKCEEHAMFGPLWDVNHTTLHNHHNNNNNNYVLLLLLLQPPFGPSVTSLRHPCVTTTHLSRLPLSNFFVSAFSFSTQLLSFSDSVHQQTWQAWHFVPP